MADERMTLERRAEIENCVWQRQNEAPTVYSAVDKITDDLLAELRAVEQERDALRDAYSRVIDHCPHCMEPLGRSRHHD